MTKMFPSKALAAIVGVVVIIASSVTFATGKQVSDDVCFQEAHVEYVVDGDTIIVEVDGSRDTVRLIGINAPESVAEDVTRNCPEGQEASDYLKGELAVGDTVWLSADTSDRDRYGRLLRYVWLQMPEDPESLDEVTSYMLNARLVAAGWAEAAKYAPDTHYAAYFEELEKCAPTPYSSGRSAHEAAA